MLVRTFKGRTTGEALAAVRAELGDAACVLETRRSDAGVEVLAAAERPGPRITRPASRAIADVIATPRRAGSISERLAALGFTAALSERLAAAVEANVDPQALEDAVASLGYLRSLLALWLPVEKNAGRGGVRVLAFVGAPGVGKTTTVAKLAARERLRFGRPVVLASADDQRLGGMEQMQGFARSLEVPFVPLHTRRDVDLARERVGGGGTLLIDTPGISRGDRPAMERLAQLLAGLSRSEVELLLAADHDAESLADTLRRFSPLRPGALGATRVDEAVRPGSLVSALARGGLPLRHVSGGPVIPEDIEDADPRRLASWAIPEERA